MILQLASLFISIAIHYSLFLGIPNIPSTNRGDSDNRVEVEIKNNKKEPSLERIIEIEEKQLKEEVKEVEKIPESEIKQLETIENSEVDCPTNQSFGGIGIEHSDSGNALVLPGTILRVYRGYPAYEAGLAVGDILLNYGQIRGTPGSTVIVLIRRGNQTFELSLVREKICFEKLKSLKELGN